LAPADIFCVILNGFEAVGPYVRVLSSICSQNVCSGVPIV